MNAQRRDSSRLQGRQAESGLSSLNHSDSVSSSCVKLEARVSMPRAGSS